MSDYAPDSHAGYAAGLDHVPDDPRGLVSGLSDRRLTGRDRIRLGLWPIGTLMPFIEYCDWCKLPLDVIVNEAEFPGQNLDGRVGFVSLADAGRLVQRIAWWSRNSDIAFHAARFMEPADLGDFGKLVFGAETVGDLIRGFNRLLPLYQTGTAAFLEPCEGGVLWRYELPEGRTPGSDILMEYMLARQVFMLDTALKGNWRPEGILLKRNCVPSASEPGRDLFAMAVPGSATNGVRLSMETMRRPLAGLGVRAADRTTLLERLTANAPAQDVLLALEQALRHALPSRSYSLAQMARRMSVSARSLQRFLAEFGLTYSRIVDDLRQQWAQDMLADSALPISEIALELGYTDSANFSRAFKRGVGQCPRSFRQASAARKAARRKRQLRSREEGAAIPGGSA
jgi:AraC-like DNA-binding protein